MSAIVRVIRGEGMRAAMTRAAERIEEATRLRLLLARDSRPVPAVPMVNALATRPSPRLGGTQAQFVWRMREERLLRNVAIAYPGILDLGAHARRVTSIHQVLELTSARAIHLEGTAGVDIDRLLRLADEGVGLIISVHDFSLAGDDPHVVGVRDERRDRSARQLLDVARALVFPSEFLLRRYRELFSMPLANAVVIEPGIPDGEPRVANGDAISFVGSVKPHKGGRLIGDVLDALDDGREVHLFGGGDLELLRPLRRRKHVHVHGYYRAGSLPVLLAQHRIGLAVLPSIVPESFGLTLSECWRAGVPAIAFAHGALEERIARHGGGWLAPLDEGASGLANLIQRWREGERIAVPRAVPNASDAARAHVALQSRLQ